MYVSLNENSRICATASRQEYLVDCFEFNFPSDFDFSTQYDYKIIDNQLIHEPLLKPDQPASVEEQLNDLTLLMAEMVGA